MTSRPWQPWAMWGLGAACYLLALFHRMSLSVAGLTAQQRFDVDATGLATFAVVQLALYGALQVPVGSAADRFGPKRLICTGMVLMAAGSAVFAVAVSYPVAVTGRALIGIGDAFMFVSVLRIAHNWFSGPRYALVAALTGMIGGLGQLVATAPLGALLRTTGWTPAFLVAAVVTAALVVVAAVALREAPVRRGAGAAGSGGPLLVSVRHVWVERGTRHAFWTHFTLMGTFISVTAVLGQPYLVGAHGLSPVSAGALISLMVVGFVLGNTLAGRLVSARLTSRGPLVRLGAIVTTLCLAVLVGLPGPLPVSVLACTLLVFGTSSVSMLAFSLASTANPPRYAGVASGVVNTGGPLFAVIAQFGVGVLLDALLGAGVHAGTAHRVSFGVIAVLAALGTLLIVGAHRHAGGARPARPEEPVGARQPAHAVS